MSGLNRSKTAKGSRVFVDAKIVGRHAKQRSQRPMAKREKSSISSLIRKADGCRVITS